MKKLLCAVGLTLGVHAFAVAGLAEGLAAIKAQDYATALKELLPVAEEGNPEAQHNLGRLYIFGMGVPKDPAKGLDWYKKAAMQGYAPAEYGLGTLYAFGDDVPKDDAEAVRWFRIAADHGNAKAQHALAIQYVNGTGVARDVGQAVVLYRKAIENGSAASFYNLGVIYANGAPGVPKNLPMAYVIFSLGAKKDVNCLGYKGIVAAQMQLEQIKRADALASAWVPGTPLPQ